MRVAIVSFDAIPDTRIEREIWTLTRRGFEVVYLGARKKGYCSIFGKQSPRLTCIELKGVRRSLAVNIVEPFASRYAAKLRRLLSNLRPDVVLAINPSAGYLASKTGFPVVVDDREYFYIQTRYASPRAYTRLHGLAKGARFAAGSLWRRLLYRVAKVEAWLAKKHPVILTTHQSVEDFSKRFGVNPARLFVLKNYPSQPELGDTIVRTPRPRVVYVGATALHDALGVIPFRDISWSIPPICKILVAGRGFEALLAGTEENVSCFRGLGWVPAPKLREVAGAGSIGLMTWRPSPIHRFFSPNKPYTYAASGSIPLLVSSLESVVEDMPWNPYIVRKEDYENSLVEILEKIAAKEFGELVEEGEKIAERARRELVWERQEEVLLDALRKA